MEERKPVLVLYKRLGCSPCTQLWNIWPMIESKLVSKFTIKVYQGGMPPDLGEIPSELAAVLRPEWYPYIYVIDGKTFDQILSQRIRPPDIRNKVRVFNGEYGSNVTTTKHQRTVSGVTEWAEAAAQEIRTQQFLTTDNLFGPRENPSLSGRGDVCRMNVVSRFK